MTRDIPDFIEFKSPPSLGWMILRTLLAVLIGLAAYGINSGRSLELAPLVVLAAMLFVALGFGFIRPETAGHFDA